MHIPLILMIARNKPFVPRFKHILQRDAARKRSSSFHPFAHILCKVEVHLDDDADNQGFVRVHGTLDTKSSLCSAELYFCSTNNGNYSGRQRLKRQMRQDTRASESFAGLRRAKSRPRKNWTIARARRTCNNCRLARNLTRWTLMYSLHAHTRGCPQFYGILHAS